ncbi:hypothetical protein ACRRTK_019536 [Alexandromys fortis]
MLDVGGLHTVGSIILGQMVLGDTKESIASQYTTLLYGLFFSSCLLVPDLSFCPS